MLVRRFFRIILITCRTIAHFFQRLTISFTSSVVAGCLARKEFIFRNFTAAPRATIMVICCRHTYPLSICIYCLFGSFASRFGTQPSFASLVAAVPIAALLPLDMLLGSFVFGSFMSSAAYCYSEHIENKKQHQNFYCQTHREPSLFFI